MVCQAQLLLTFLGPETLNFYVNLRFYSYQHYRCCQGDSRSCIVATQSILIIPSADRISVFKIADKGSFSHLLCI